MSDDHNKRTPADLITYQQALKDAEEQIKKLTDQLAMQAAEFKKLSYYDSLTNLPNRLQFDADLQREVARVKRYDRKLALLYISLDSFNKVKDSYGQQLGDLLLQEIAKRLNTLLRAEDSIARLSESEFAFILTEIDHPHAAGVVAHRMVEKMREPYRILGRTIIVGVSVGIACYPDMGKDGMTLHKNAAMALRSAQALGQNNYQFFTAGLQEQNDHKLEIEADLHFALEREEFFLVYQPRMDLQKETMVGMEVLLRWQHPVRGLIAPSEFISIAEETGLIIPLGEWVLKTACKQFASWRAQNNNFSCTLAVNVSPRQFQRRNFVDIVLHILAETNLPAHLLELEITETSMLGSLGKIEDSLFQLSRQGVQFSIDDFGTGYSSLTRVKDLPIQAIKIDRSFVQDINIKVSDNVIIKSTIDMAKGMGLNVVAEGVETESQLQFLRNNECPQAQGYYYSKPLTVVQMTEFIAKTSGTSC